MAHGRLYPVVDAGRLNCSATAGVHALCMAGSTGCMVTSHDGLDIMTHPSFGRRRVVPGRVSFQ